MSYQSPNQSLCFIVPAYGRLDLTRVCLRQLARTCETLTGAGIEASAVVIADDENLDVACELGFGTVRRDNRPLGRKWNDGFELAGLAGADYMIPCGSDDWIDPAFILSGDLPAPDTVRCARRSAIVNETGTRLAHLRIPYDGGDGIRIIPRQLLQPFGFRPAVEDAPRAIDTSVLTRLRPRLAYHDLHPLQVVDFKSREQLNSYRDCLTFLDGDESADPFGDLAAYYPAEAVGEMRTLYERRLVAA